MRYFGHNIGDSLLEADWVEKAGEMMKTAKDKGVKFLIPVDNKVGKEYDENTESKIVSSDDIPDGWMGLDIGPETQKLFADAINHLNSLKERTFRVFAHFRIKTNIFILRGKT